MIPENCKVRIMNDADDVKNFNICNIYTSRKIAKSLRENIFFVFYKVILNGGFNKYSS